MTAKQVFWLLAFWIVIWTGKTGLDLYLDHRLAIRRLELSEGHNRLLEEYAKQSLERNSEFNQRALDIIEGNRKLQDRLEQSK